MKERRNSALVTSITLGDLIGLSNPQINRRTAGEESDKHQEHNDRKAAEEPLQIDGWTPGCPDTSTGTGGLGIIAREETRSATPAANARD